MAGVCRYRQCLANTAGLSLSSVTVTTQQAGSLVLPTALAFPAPTPLYTTLASSMEASLRTNPPSAFTSDPSFASQYGPVTFQGFSFVGPGGTALSPGPPDAAGVEGSLDSSPSEGSLDSSPGAPGLQALGEVLRPIEAAKLARIEGYGTFIPVNGYSPPPPPPNPPSSPPSPPLSLPPGATAAPTVTATPGVASPGAATPTPTPAPAETSSSVSLATSGQLFLVLPPP